MKDVNVQTTLTVEKNKSTQGLGKKQPFHTLIFIPYGGSWNTTSYGMLTQPHVLETEEFERRKNCPSLSSLCRRVLAAVPDFFLGFFLSRKDLRR